MDSNILNNRAFSLVELSIVILIIAVVIFALFYASGKIRQTAQAQRITEELEAITIASTRYYSENGAWPESISDLRPKYLSPSVNGSNPFGYSYLITPEGPELKVSTVLPSGLISSKSFGTEVVVVNQGSTDSVSVTKPVISGTWQLKYDKKYLYGQ